MLTLCKQRRILFLNGCVYGVNKLSFSSMRLQNLTLKKQQTTLFNIYFFCKPGIY